MHTNFVNNPGLITNLGRLKGYMPKTASFEFPEDGIRALALRVLCYQRGMARVACEANWCPVPGTIEHFVASCVPHVYAATLRRKLRQGVTKIWVAPLTVVNLSRHIEAIVRCVIDHSAQTYTDDEIFDGIEMAWAVKRHFDPQETDLAWAMQPGANDKRASSRRKQEVAA